MKRKPVAREEAIQAVRTLIRYIGDNPDREGLERTPERVIRAWEMDWGIGYNTDYWQKEIASITGGKFHDGAEDYNEMIAVKKISFVSHCEHHLAEFSGTVDIAYIPRKKGPILGLSKLARIVALFSRRLQVQERMTREIADFIDGICKPAGVGVVVRATHSCMISRGVRQHGTIAVTSALRGEFLNEPEVRDEFFRLAEK